MQDMVLNTEFEMLQDIFSHVGRPKFGIHSLQSPLWRANIFGVFSYLTFRIRAGGKNPKILLFACREITYTFFNHPPTSLTGLLEPSRALNP